jgi:hypothetical protein
MTPKIVNTFLDFSKLKLGLYLINCKLKINLNPRKSSDVLTGR